MESSHPAPFATIVTPVLNGMPWLPEAIESIFSQRTDTITELIVLDGGSTDGSREWLMRNVGEKGTLIFDTDHGQTDALIRGFHLAAGAMLGWLNADDVLEPGALALVASAFREHPDAVMVSGRCLQIDMVGRVLGVIPEPPSPTVDALLAFPSNLPQPATFFRKSAYDSVGGLDPALDMAMDVDLWMKLARVGELHLLHDQTLARFRLHGSGKSQAGSVAAAREDLSVRRRHGMPIPSRAWWLLVKQAYLSPWLRAGKFRLKVYERFQGRGSGHSDQGENDAEDDRNGSTR